MTTNNTSEERMAFMQYIRMMSDDEIVAALEDASTRSDADAAAMLQEALNNRQLFIEGNSF